MKKTTILPYWVEEIFRFGPEIERRATRRLAERGVLQTADAGGRPGRQKYQLAEKHAERDLKFRIFKVLYRDGIPDPRDAALISLVDAGGVFDLLFSPRELRRIGDRIAQVRKLDMIGQAVAATIEGVRERLAGAIGNLQ